MLRSLLGLWFPKVHRLPLGQQTFRKHLNAAFFEGIFNGIMVLQGFLLRKELHASDFEVTLLFALPAILCLFSSFGAQFITFGNHRKVILAAGFFGRLSVATICINFNPVFIIAIASWVGLVHSVFLPANNIILRSNYLQENRGISYAQANSLALLLTAVTSSLAGRLLEWDERIFPYLFLIAAFFGFFTYATYYFMPRDPVREAEIRGMEKPQKRAIGGNFFRVLKEDKFFREYEAYFFIYGCGFMVTAPMVPLYVADVLQANWAEAAKALGMIHPLVMIVFLPLFGRLLDRSNAILVACLACLALAFWPLTLALTTNITSAYVAYVFFGIGMAGIDMAWMLGAMEFTQEENVPSYMGVHVTLVGLRAAIGPFLGLYIKRQFGFQPTFFLSVLLFLTGSALMFHLYRRRERATYPPERPPEII